MQTGSIPRSTLDGGLHLRATLESGLTFLWRRVDDRRYGATPPASVDSEDSGDGTADDGAGGVTSWYYTVTDDAVVFVRQRDGGLDWRASTDAEELVRRRLRLDDDLDAVFETFPDDPVLQRAQATFPGLRVVRDPFFPCLISFVCSARTGVARIHELQTALAQKFGSVVSVDADPAPTEADIESAAGDRLAAVDRPYRAFPSPETLAGTSEEALRDLGLGFRAPRVRGAAAAVADGDVTASGLRDDTYERARERLQTVPGVGPKVADCVALFALGHLQAVPVDRWTRRFVEAYYSDCARRSDEATATAFRERFGRYAGYAQTYLYHYVRSSASDAV